MVPGADVGEKKGQTRAARGWAGARRPAVRTGSLGRAHTRPLDRRRRSFGGVRMTSYPVELDVRLVFVPPMDEQSSGIVLTRRIELPFVPYNGLRIHCRAWHDCAEPFGLSLTDVIWDMDRQVFLAVTHHIHDSFPIAFIVDEVRTWVARGWRIGSSTAWYDEREASAGPGDARPTPDGWLIDGDHPDFERLHLLPPDQRPAIFNRFWKALIRTMIEDRRNWAAAYAMDRTGTWGPDGDYEARTDWFQQCRDFDAMDSADQLQWLDRVRAYPDVARVLRSRPKRATSVRDTGR